MHLRPSSWRTRASKPKSLPDFSRTAMSLSPISLMATSHDTRCHCPPVSFIGYFRRRSPPTISRTAAPLAQCEPRLIGESQLGSWPTQTPFTTSAVTVQPTEQCVQMLLRMVAPATLGPAASAFCTVASGNAPMVARPVATSPDLRKKLRRSRPPAVWLPTVAARLPRRV